MKVDTTFILKVQIAKMRLRKVNNLPKNTQVMADLGSAKALQGQCSRCHGLLLRTSADQRALDQKVKKDTCLEIEKIHVYTYLLAICIYSV